MIANRDRAAMQTLLALCSGWLHPYFHWDSSWSMLTPDQQPGFVYDCKHAYNCASTALKWARDQTKDWVSADICYLTLEACFGRFRSAQRHTRTARGELTPGTICSRQQRCPDVSRGVSHPLCHAVHTGLQKAATQVSHYFRQSKLRRKRLTKHQLHLCASKASLEKSMH